MLLQRNCISIGYWEAVLHEKRNVDYGSIFRILGIQRDSLKCAGGLNLKFIIAIAATINC